MSDQDEEVEEEVADGEAEDDQEVKTNIGLFIHADFKCIR